MSRAIREMHGLMRAGYWIKYVDYESACLRGGLYAVLVHPAKNDVLVLLDEAGDEEFASDLATTGI